MQSIGQLAHGAAASLSSIRKTTDPVVRLTNQVNKHYVLAIASGGQPTGIAVRHHNRHPSLAIACIDSCNMLCTE
jgi:hypothetical protein